MATICTFLKRTVGKNSSNNNHLNIRSATDDTSERLNKQQTNDSSNNSSPLGTSINNNDESLRRPLLNIISKNRHRRFLCHLMHNSTKMNTQLEQLIDENTCLLNTNLPKELILR